MNEMIICRSLKNDFSTVTKGRSADPAVLKWRVVCNMLFTVLVMALLAPATQSEAASPAADVSGYEIPLGELQKVKKERPVKKESRDRRKKKSDGAESKPTYGVVVAPEQGEKTDVTVPQVATLTTKNTVSSPVMPATLSKISGSLSIHHDPYSYVIAGKRTTIQAIISSTSNIQSAVCRFRSTDSGVFAQVPMVTVPGTFFTYSTTLPSLAPVSKELRYSIEAVDTAGNLVKSQEFVVAVKATSVLPGWQTEITPDAIKIKIDQKDKPFEGFADPGISE